MPKTFDKSQTEKFLSTYDQLLKRFGKSNTLVASMFHQAAVEGHSLMVVCDLVMEKLASTDVQANLLKAKAVAEYLKAHPAIMAVRYIDGRVNTFRPYQLAGIMCLVEGATGQEPEVADYPIRDSQDLETIAKYAYLWCYSPSAYKELVEGGDNN